MKASLNSSQRIRGLEGCLLSTHLLAKKSPLNGIAAAAGKQCMEAIADNKADHNFGPPSLAVGMAVILYGFGPSCRP